MGFRSLGSLVLILLIVVVLFGTRRLRAVGNDLGAAVRGFRQGLEGKEEKKLPKDPST